MPRLSRLLSPCFGALLLAGCGDGGVGGVTSAITHPSDDDGDPAVVAIVPPGGSSPDCTGTLIAPRVILTAAHCVRSGQSSVRFGATLDVARAIAVTVARVHPQYRASDHAFDVALLLLAEPAPAAPLALAATVAAELAGMPARVVGFGRTSAADATEPRKRSGLAVVSAVADGDLTLTASPSQPCEGDSGGPVFVTLAGTEVVAGVVAAGDVDCTAYARAIRVDAVADFVSAFVAAVADGAAASGQRCYDDANCAVGTCVAASDELRLSFCAVACAADADCACGSADCATLRCRDGVCRHAAPSPGALGSSCSAPADCVDGLCVGGACSLRCFTDIAESCPSAFRCSPDPTTPGSSACVAAGGGCAVAPAGGGPGPLVLLGLVALGGRVSSRRRQRPRYSSTSPCQPSPSRGSSCRA